MTTIIVDDSGGSGGRDVIAEGGRLVPSVAASTFFQKFGGIQGEAIRRSVVTHYIPCVLSGSLKTVIVRP